MRSIKPAIKFAIAFTFLLPAAAHAQTQRSNDDWSEAASTNSATNSTKPVSEVNVSLPRAVAKADSPAAATQLPTTTGGLDVQAPAHSNSAETAQVQPTRTSIDKSATSSSSAAADSGSNALSSDNDNTDLLPPPVMIQPKHGSVSVKESRRSLRSETGQEHSGPLPDDRSGGTGEETTRQSKTRSNKVAVMSPAKSDDLLDGLEIDDWLQIFNGAKQDFSNRVYNGAETKLLQAIKISKQGFSNTKKLVSARNVLGDVYLAQDRYEDAEKLYNWCVSASRRENGPEAEATAHAQYGLATVLMIKDKLPEAHELCKQALKTQKQLRLSRHDYGQSLITMGAILSKEGWNDQADRFFQAGLNNLEREPGVKQLDYADALQVVALHKQAQGLRQEAQTFFEKSYAIKDRATSFDQTAQLQGQVKFKWEEGSPRSEEIPDPIVPLRYICSNNIRVACTVVDLWELFGVLISVTNIGDHRTDIGLGKVYYLRSDGDPNCPKLERLQLIDPKNIDRIRREVDIWRLTSTRPWLANMQKSRNIRGLVPARGHDLFRGPNLFGVYGEWAAPSRVLPEKFQLEPSPERVVDQAQVLVDPNMVHANNIKILGLIPVSLDPFESRTGELFYMNPRCEHVVLRIFVGNTEFEFPFKTPKKRTGI